jgi:cytochrome P450
VTRTDALPPTPPGLPILGNTVGFVRDPLGFVRDSIASTGDEFRMRLPGDDVYVLGHPDLVETALLDREAFAKLDDFTIAFGDALLAVHGEQWTRQRHAMESFFSPTRIGEHVETMMGVAESRMADWRAGASVRVDEWARSLALENLFEVVFGRSLPDERVDALTDSTHALNGWVTPSSWVLPNWLPTPARRAFRRGSATLRDQSKSLLDGRAAGPDEDSLLATLSALRDDPDSGFDRAEVLDQVVGMVFAGHETTALSLTFALHLLGSHPEVARRVEAEADETLEGPPSATDLRGLDVLDRVIRETMRLYPPVHAIPRVTTESVSVGEYTLPADAPVLLGVWSLHRDPRFYDDPETFDPTRWAATTPRERGYAFLPFGGGPRICIGRHFAKLVLKATLAAVCRRWRVEASGDLTVTPRMTTQPEGQVELRVRKRGG